MDVEMEVLSHEIVGTYICALTKSAERPATVAELMQDIARYINDEFDGSSASKGRVLPVDALKAGRSSAVTPDDVVIAEFVSDDGSDAEDALGTWQISPFVFFRNVKRNAGLTLVWHADDNIILRLPEKALLEKAEDEASKLARLGDPEKFPLPNHYQSYDSKTSMEVLTSNIGYYVTASCR